MVINQKAKKMLKIKPFIKLNIQLGDVINIGQTKEGYLKIIPIVSGFVSGSLKGKVLSYGGDINYKNDEIYSLANATYIIQTNDGENILVHNIGKIDKNHAMFTSPSFIVNQDGPYKGLDYRHFVGQIVSGNLSKIEIIIDEIVDS